MYYVYILKSLKNNKLYKAYTNDLRRRIREHNSKKITFTKNNGPWELIYYEAFISEKDAKREELFLKSGKGRERIKYLFQE
ncbi:MAG: GIY-YIG nuclease family protein [Patescibacteria group bacterium]|nr:GIY-YIG nuclease family protein [Patescibacteria group bacterium]